jgi:GNAT superfamily N-acetyltransferase
MSTLELISNYSKDDTTRERLYPLFQKAFGIPPEVFQDFHARGFWNPTYTPYTLFDGETAVANVSMFTLPLVVGGQRIEAAGIQSVMTDPDHRGKGLMKQLFAKTLEDIDQQFEATFLMTGSPELYTGFGFRVLQQHVFVAAYQYMPAEEVRSLQKIDFENEGELQIVRDLFQTHQPVSNQFAPLSYPSSFFLNMYNPFFNEKLYVAEELQAVLVFEVKEGTLRLFDVIAERIPTLEEIAAYVAEPFSKIELHFGPDRFTGAAFEPVLVEGGDVLMVRGAFEVENQAFKLQPTASF